MCAGLLCSLPVVLEECWLEKSFLSSAVYRVVVVVSQSSVSGGHPDFYDVFCGYFLRKIEGSFTQKLLQIVVQCNTQFFLVSSK